MTFDKILKINRQKRKIKIKCFGITLYEKSIDNEECFIKTKYLSGLFYKKFDIYNKTFKFQIFGFSIFKTKLKGSYKLWYFLFIPIWIKNVNKEFLNNFLDNAILKYPNFEDYYIFLSRSGEFFLLMHHFAQWLHNNKSSNFILIFTAKYHLNICKMFFPNIPTAYIKRVNVPLVSRGVSSVNFKYKNKQIFVPTNEKYFVDVENKIRDNNAHYYECLKEHLGLNNDIQHYVISEKTKEKVMKIVKYILNDNFVFISPETLSNESMEKDFWENFVLQLKNLGYEVFCNAMDFKNLVGDSTSVFLTYEESIELAKYAKAIIGMRSGFLECLSQNNIPVFALYTDFPKRSGFKRLKSDKVLSGYSISKLPNVNPNLLYEYDVNKYRNNEDLIPEILSKIQNINLINRTNAER
ncbi:MAG: hypothetical protein ACI4S3_08670 [Candidatus Gastranaerophilaceae bacterium]